MPRVAREYRTLPCPEGCHVMGVSMGGAGTLRFVLNRPELFASATIISGPILSTEQMVSFVRNPLLVPIIPTGRIWGPPNDLDRIRSDDPYLRWTSQEDLHGMRLMLAWGTRDRGQIVETSESFEAHLDAHDIDHEVLVYEGNHSWVSWSPVIREALRRQLGDRLSASAGSDSASRSAGRAGSAAPPGGSTDRVARAARAPAAR